MPANAPQANRAAAAASSTVAAGVAPVRARNTTTSSSRAVIPAPNRGPRGSIPGRRSVGASDMVILQEGVEGGEQRRFAGNAADAGPHGAGGVEQQGGR